MTFPPDDGRPGQRAQMADGPSPKLGEPERSMDLAAGKTRGQESALILLDGDDDCPAQLGLTVLQRAVQSRADRPVAVVIAKREFEAWSLAAAISLRGAPADLRPPADQERVRVPKESFGRQVDGQYGEALDQSALVARLDLTLALQAGSFEECHREVVRLLTRG